MRNQQNMQLSQIKSKSFHQSKKRVGRGGKRGTYSGRGVKGQNSRSGATKEPIIRPLIKRYHKLKGIGFSPPRQKIVTVKLGDLAKKFQEGATVNPQILKEKGLISPKPGKRSKVKILSSDWQAKKLIFENCQFSKTAQEEIEKIGGEIKS